MRYGLHDVGVLRAHVRAMLPERWANRIIARVDGIARGRRWSEEADEFVRDLLEKGEYPLPLSATDHDVCSMAESLARRHEQLNGLPIREFAYAQREIDRDLSRFRLADPGAARRMCPRWWKRNLRRALNHATEVTARAFGYVGGRGDRYISDESYRRDVERQRDNQAAIEAAEIQDEEGNRESLGRAVQSSVSNPEVRRAELMTRVRGFEEVAAALNHVGVFLTATLPSRFHPVRADGSVNKNFDGSTVAEGQADLNSKWVKFRARVAKEGVRIYGFRVVEPHKSGTAHWHILLFVEREKKKAMLRHFIELFRDGDEVSEGETRKHRVKIKTMNPLLGGAAAYIAKYIAKNIDGAHMDEKTKGDAPRVRSWASTHRIRQFQQFGGPRVTVWRELRRIEREQLASVSETHAALADAVHRTDEDRADWSAFCRLVGGVPGLNASLSVELERIEDDSLNCYEERRGARIWGVRAGLVRFETRSRKWRVVWNRSQKSTTERSRTRFNNCNHRNPIFESGSFIQSVRNRFETDSNCIGAIKDLSGVKSNSRAEKLVWNSPREFEQRE